MNIDHNKAQMQAIGFALAGFFFWVGADTCMKFAANTHLPAYEVIGFLGLFTTVLMGVKAASQKKIKALWPRKPRNQLLMASLLLICNYANVFALKHLSLTMFYVTVFMAPFMIALLAARLLNEKMSIAKWAAIMAGFAGVVIAVDPFNSLGNGGDLIGYAAALASTTAFSVSTVLLRVLTQSESSDSLAFFTGFVQAIFGLLLMAWHAEPLTVGTMLTLMLMAGFCVAGNLCNFGALRLTHAATVAQFHYSQIVGGILLGYLIWHDVPTHQTLLGAAIIIASGLYIAAHTRRKENMATVAPH